MPVISRFGAKPGAKGQEGQGIAWVAIDIADADERAWLEAWPGIGDQTRTLVLEPVRLSRRDHTADGMFLSVRSMRTGATGDVDHLTDLKLLIGQSIQQVLAPIATDPALTPDEDDRETLVRSSNHVTARPMHMQNHT